MNKNHFQSISDTLFELLNSDVVTSSTEIERINNQMGHISIIHFLSFRFMAGTESFNIRMFIFLIDYWEKLTFEDWKTIIYLCSNDGGALYYLFRFTYIFIKVDFLGEYANMEGVDKELREKCLRRYKKLPKTFFDRDTNLATDLLKKFGKDENCLNGIKDNLVKQGAKPAEPIILQKKKEEQVYEIQVPRSWQWVDDY